MQKTEREEKYKNLALNYFFKKISPFTTPEDSKKTLCSKECVVKKIFTLFRIEEFTQRSQGGQRLASNSKQQPIGIKSDILIFRHSTNKIANNTD